MAENFIISAQQVLVLFVLIGVGFLCGKKGILTDHSSKHITDIVLYIVTPCVMVSAFQRKFSMELVGNIIIGVIFSAVIIAISILIAKITFHDKNKVDNSVYKFATIFSNCGFMSLPLQKAILGDDGWFYGSIFIAVFNIFLWTYGLVMMSGDKKQLSLKKLALNPGIVGVVIALILFVSGIELPYIVAKPIEYLSDLNTPLPMMVVGFYLSQANLKKAFTGAKIYLTLAVRLIIIPLIAVAAMTVLKIDPAITVSFTIACAAPTAATTTMFSAKFNRNVELSVSLVASTTIVSIITMPAVVALAQLITA